MTGPAEHDEPCCHDRETGWLLDDLATLSIYGGIIATDLIDRLPPAKAALHVRAALQGWARLEQGTADDLVIATRLAIGNPQHAAPGWWSRYLTGRELSIPIPVPI